MYSFVKYEEKYRHFNAPLVSIYGNKRKYILFSKKIEETIGFAPQRFDLLVDEERKIIAIAFYLTFNGVYKYKRLVSIAGFLNKYPWAVGQYKDLMYAKHSNIDVYILTTKI